MSQLLRPLSNGELIRKNDLYETSSGQLKKVGNLDKNEGLRFKVQHMVQVYRPVVSLKHLSATIIYWAAVGFITVVYFFFITCVK